MKKRISASPDEKWLHNRVSIHTHTHTSTYLHIYTSALANELRPTLFGHLVFGESEFCSELFLFYRFFSFPFSFSVFFGGNSLEFSRQQLRLIALFFFWPSKDFFPLVTFF